MLSPRKPLSFHPPSSCSPVPCHSSSCRATTSPSCSHLPTLDAGTFTASAGILGCLENHCRQPALALLTEAQPSRLPEHPISLPAASIPCSQLPTSPGWQGQSPFPRAAHQLWLCGSLPKPRDPHPIPFTPAVGTPGNHSKLWGTRLLCGMSAWIKRAEM